MCGALGRPPHTARITPLTPVRIFPFPAAPPMPPTVTHRRFCPLVRLALGLFLVLAPTVASAKPDQEAQRLFTLGNRLLDAGDVDGAVAAYEAAAATGWTSGALEHNRGLAELERGRTADAVLHLRRAARLLPGEAAVRQSLDAALARAGLAAPPEGAAHRLARTAAGPLGVGGLLAGALLLGLAAVWAARRGGLRRPRVLVPGGLALAVWLLAALAWQASAPRGVVLLPTALRAAPAEGAAAGAVLPAGRGVRLGRRVGAWQAARLPDGTEGWLPVRAVEDV